MALPASVGKITPKDYWLLMDLLANAEQGLAGLKSPRAQEARQTLQQCSTYLRDNTKWCKPNKSGIVPDETLKQILWGLNYASVYLENLLSDQAAWTRRSIEQTVKPHVNRMSLYARRHPVSPME